MITHLPNPFTESAGAPAIGKAAVAVVPQPVATAVAHSAREVSSAPNAPGMVRNGREQNFELPDIPSFLRRARPAHDAIEPEAVDGVITIANQNIAGTP